MSMNVQLNAIEFQNMVNHRYATLHAIEKALDMLEVWYCQTEDKDDHESSYVIRPAIQKADEALTVIRDELKRELRKAFRMPETKDAAGR